MIISKFMPLKNIITMSTRNYSRLRGLKDNSSLHNRTVQFVATSPNTQIAPFLDQYVEEGNAIKPTELRNIIQTLRRKNFFDRALEVSQWMAAKSLSPPGSGDLAVQLHLICRVQGTDAAERFFNNSDDHSEKMHSALLSCYVRENCIDKSLSLFRKMKDMGLPMSPLAYNNMMSLYMKIGQVEKVPQLLSEMVYSGISPDLVSCNICLKSFAVKSDFTSLELIVKKMENLPCFSMDWSIYAAVANYFMERSFKEKAIYYLQKAVHIVPNDAVGYNILINLCAKLGDVTQVMRLWQKRKEVCRKAPINADYINMIGSLVKLNEFQEAERVFQEWESSGNRYDVRVPNVLLFGCSRKGLVEKAENVLKDIIGKGNLPSPKAWSIVCAAHIKCQNMDKALQYMKKALELGPQNQRWLPNAEVVDRLLKWLGDNGKTEQENELVELLRKVIPEDHKMYQKFLARVAPVDRELLKLLRIVSSDTGW